MRRYYIDETIEKVGIYQLTSEDSHHINKVLRLNVGDEIHLTDSEGEVFLARIEALSDYVSVEVIEKAEVVDSELLVEVTIAVGLSKGDKLDWIAQKGTECGMKAMIPLTLKRDVVKWTGKKANKKIERLNKITDEASKQSKRLIRPQVSQLHTLEELVGIAPGFDWLIIANEEYGHQGKHSRLKEILTKAQAGDKILAVFGSEGGFDPSEIKFLEESSFVSCSLGPRILRAETAPLYLLNAISYETELS